jgi:hypothetical protein
MIRVRYANLPNLGLVSLLMLGLSLVITLPSLAHHSVSGQFDVSKEIILKGTVDKVSWVNPHIYVHLKVVDESGDSAVWRLGTVPVAMARAAGISKESLYGEGKDVVITAYPARDGTDHLGFLTRIEYHDGTFVSVRPDRL